MNNEFELKDDKLYLILRGHLFIDNELSNLLDGFIPNPKGLKLYSESFSRKIALALSLNLIQKNHYDALSAFNKFRNQYAHNLHYNIKSNEIKDFKDNLSKIEGLEIFANTIIVGDKISDITDLKTIIIGLKLILGERAKRIIKCEDPIYTII